MQPIFNGTVLYKVDKLCHVFYDRNLLEFHKIAEVVNIFYLTIFTK